MPETASRFRIPRTREYCGFWAFCIAAVLDLAFGRIDPWTGRTHFLACVCAVPACSGLLAVLIYGYTERRRYEECLRVSQWAVAWLYLALLLLAILGLPLLALYILNVVYLSAVLYAVIGLPLAILLAAIGGTLGYLLQRAVPRKARFSSIPYTEARQ